MRRRNRGNYGNTGLSIRNRYRGNDSRNYRDNRDSDIYENEFIDEAENYGPSRSYENRYRNYEDDRTVFARVGDGIRNTWNDRRNEHRDRDNEYTRGYDPDSDHGYIERRTRGSNNNVYDDSRANRRREDVTSYRRNMDDDGYNRRDVDDRLYNELNDDYDRDYDRRRLEFGNRNRGLGAGWSRKIDIW